MRMEKNLHNIGWRPAPWRCSFLRGLALVLLFLVGEVNASPEMSYTNWPGTDLEWVTLTNHISWCYRALVARMNALAPDVSVGSTNDIVPSYVHPYRDYLRFADKIDALAPYYVCQTQAVATGDARTEYKKWFTTQQSDGSYTNDFPFWTVTNLHVQAFGKVQWTTNFPLHAWMAITNRSIQKEVQSAITNLLWTRRITTSGNAEGPIHKVRATSKPCLEDGYPSGVDTNSSLATAKSYQSANWSASTYGKDSLYSSYYAVGYSLCHTFNTVYGARGYAKPVLDNCSTCCAVNVSWYLQIDYQDRNYIQHWYNYDNTSYWDDIQTNHVVAVDFRSFYGSQSGRECIICGLANTKLYLPCLLNKSSLAAEMAVWRCATSNNSIRTH